MCSTGVTVVNYYWVVWNWTRNIIFKTPSIAFFLFLQQQITRLSSTLWTAASHSFTGLCVSSHIAVRNTNDFTCFAQEWRNVNCCCKLSHFEFLKKAKSSPGVIFNFYILYLGLIIWHYDKQRPRLVCHNVESSLLLVRIGFYWFLQTLAFSFIIL